MTILMHVTAILNICFSDIIRAIQIHDDFKRFFQDDDIGNLTLKTKDGTRLANRKKLVDCKFNQDTVLFIERKETKTTAEEKHTVG
jgi:hypothetical protein